MDDTLLYRQCCQYNTIQYNIFKYISIDRNVSSSAIFLDFTCHVADYDTDEHRHERSQ